MFNATKVMLDKKEMKGETDFYKLFNYSLQVSRALLNKSGINLSLDDEKSINTIIAQHICETMDVNTLLVVMYYILQNKDTGNLTLLEQDILNIFEDILLKIRNVIFFVLVYFREKIKSSIKVYEYVPNNSKTILEHAKPKNIEIILVK